MSVHVIPQPEERKTVSILSDRQLGVLVKMKLQVYDDSKLLSLPRSARIKGHAPSPVS